MVRWSRGWVLVLASLLTLVLLAAACAKAEEKTAAPAPSAPSPAPAAPTAAPAPAPAPTAASAPTTAAAPTPAPAAAAAKVDGQPLVPGGPPFYASELAKTRGWQLFEKWHYTKLSLWTKAKYGGHSLGMQPEGSARTSFRMHTVTTLNRPTVAGMLLYADSGRCSLVGRDEDFSVCKGEYARNDGYVLVPGIFQRWEQPDPVTYIFHVRKGVLWPATPPMARTNREVTAEDIVFFLEATKKDGITRQNLALAKQFEALDRYTVRISMLSPSADFFLNLAHTSQGIFPRECYEEKDCLGSIKSVSPGPFLVTEFDQGVKLVFEKNPEFYLKGLPYWDGMTLFNVTDQSAQKAGFLTGKADYLLNSSTAETEDVLKRIPGLQVHAPGGIGAVTGILRPQLEGPLADGRVRRAMMMTLDHPSMWDASLDGLSMFTPIVGRQYFGNFYMTREQMGENYQFNPTRAKQLMAEAGYGEGFTTSVTQSITVAAWINTHILFAQAQWKKHLGVDLKINGVDPVTFANQYLQSSWKGLLNQVCCWIPSCWASADDVFAQFLKGSPQNVQKLYDPVIEEMYLKQRGELDPVKRVKLLWEFDQYELSKVYTMRTGMCAIIGVQQPWEMNGASHETMYFSALNGPTWLGMHDTSKYPSGRR